MIEEEIDKNIFQYTKYISLINMFKSLSRLDIINIKGFRLNRINSDLDWVGRGCPSTDYVLEIYIVTDGISTTIEWMI